MSEVKQDSTEEVGQLLLDYLTGNDTSTPTPNLDLTHVRKVYENISNGPHYETLRESMLGSINDSIKTHGEHHMNTIVAGVATVFLTTLIHVLGEEYTFKSNPE